MHKYQLTVIIVFFILLYSTSYVYAKTRQLELLGKVIYIDCGHGGSDPGAMYKDIMEKDINLKIGQNLEKKLTELGAIVYMTRYGDYDLSVTYTNNNKRSDLSRRANLINSSKADMFISIHLNAENTGLWKGSQVFYNNKNKKNELLAQIFQNNFKKILHSKRKSKINNDLYLLKRIKQPGILLELGFLSNGNDRYLLKQATYQDKIVNTIILGIKQFFEL
ncbi:MAG: N-acetylmuramoyl-L-alanine amidase [Bacilli bacterium]|nr:N-acetylmuramoyl-L-alanine amidase [Bacilli bacterium]